MDEDEMSDRRQRASPRIGRALRGLGYLGWRQVQRLFQHPVRTLGYLLLVSSIGLNLVAMGLNMVLAALQSKGEKYQDFGMFFNGMEMMFIISAFAIFIGFVLHHVGYTITGCKRFNGYFWLLAFVQVMQNTTFYHQVAGHWPFLE